jgi:hypothetical protein
MERASDPFRLHAMEHADTSDTARLLVGMGAAEGAKALVAMQRERLCAVACAMDAARVGAVLNAVPHHVLGHVIATIPLDKAVQLLNHMEPCKVGMMSQAKHAGKVVVNPRTAQGSRSGGLYVLSGGPRLHRSPDNCLSVLTTPQLHEPLSHESLHSLRRVEPGRCCPEAKRGGDAVPPPGDVPSAGHG